jgi:hypothetical protein
LRHQKRAIWTRLTIFQTVSEEVFSETHMLALWDFLETRRFRRHFAF